MVTKIRKGFGIGKIIGIAIVLLAALAAAIPFLLDINQFRPQIESQLAGALGRDVKVDNLSLSLLSGGIRVNNIRIADNPAFGSAPFVQAKSLQPGVELKTLIFSKSVRITRISLDGPFITLIRSSSGKWNISDLGGRAGAPKKVTGVDSGITAGTDVSIKQLKITGGRVTIVGSNRKSTVYDNVYLVVNDLSFTSEFPFRLTASLPGGGDFRLEGKAGPLNTADMARTPLSADLAVSKLDIVSSGFVAADSGISGVMDLKGTVACDGSKMRSIGQAQAGRLQFVKGGAPAARPVSLDYGVDYDLAQRNGVLSEAKVGYGSAAASLTGNYDLNGETVLLHMKVRGIGMPLQDLETLLPAFAVTMPKGASLQGGTLTARIAAEGPIEKMVIAGTVDVNRTRLVGFDLADEMSALAALAGLKPDEATVIEKFAAYIKQTSEGTQVSNLLLIVPAIGTLYGNGRIGVDQSLDFKMRARLQPSGGIAQSLGKLVGSNTLEIPFLIRGTASDPKFVADMKEAAGGLLESIMSGKGGKKEQTDSGKSLEGSLLEMIQKKK